MVCTSDGSGTECNAIPGDPTSELCDGLDNDCDESTDEDLTRQTTCGVGECSGNTGEELCTTGTWGGDTCDPFEGAAENDATCDGTDDDCDGAEDEDYQVTSTSCGVGVCASKGQLECQGGTEVDTCVEGQPTETVTISFDEIRVADTPSGRGWGEAEQRATPPPYSYTPRPH